MGVTTGLLHQTAPTGGQIANDLGAAHGQPVEVDHVEIGPIARRHHPPVAQPVGHGGGAGLLGHQQLEGQALAPGAVPGPMGQQVGGGGGVADGGHVGAAVGQPADGVGVPQHGPHHLQVAAAVVLEGVQEQGLAVLGQQQIQGQFPRAHPGPSGPTGNGPLGGGLVVGRVTQLKGALQGPGHPGVEGIVGAFFHQSPAQLGVVAQALHPLGQGQIRHRPVGRMAGEEVHGGVQAHHHPDGSNPDLTPNG